MPVMLMMCFAKWMCLPVSSLGINCDIIGEILLSTMRRCVICLAKCMVCLLLVCGVNCDFQVLQVRDLHVGETF